jgi:hypothetical protein
MIYIYYISMETRREIIITNKEIWEFYNQEYPFLDIETTNILLINLIRSLLENNNEKMNSSITSQILKQCLANNVKMDNISIEIQTLINKTQSELTSKLYELKNQYLDDMKTFIQLENHSTQDKLRTFIQSNMDEKMDVVGQKLIKEITEYSLTNINSNNKVLLESINSLMIQLLPDNNQMLMTKINEEIHKFQLFLLEESNKITQTPSYIETIIKSLHDVSCKNDINIQNVNTLISGNKTSQIEAYLTSVDSRYVQLHGNIQRTINEILSSSEERIKTSFSNLHEFSLKQNLTQEKMNVNLEEFLQRYKNNSSVRGKSSELEVKELLQQKMPTCEVEHVGSDAHTCDFIIRRGTNKPDVLIENKIYTCQIPTGEVNKYIKDCLKHKKCGMMLSQSTAICHRNDYQVEIIGDEFVLIYIHSVEYNWEKIRIGLDIIDTLYSNLKRCSSQDGIFSITEEQIRFINHEYSSIIRQRDASIVLLKDNHRAMVKCLEDIKLPSLETLIGTTISFDHIETTTNSPLSCDICKNFTGRSKASLGAHRKACIKKNNEKTDSE